jgi:hypothetical protein
MRIRKQVYGTILHLNSVLVRRTSSVFDLRERARSPLLPLHLFMVERIERYEEYD